MKQNGFTLRKAWRRRSHTQSITDANNADGIALLEIITIEVESLLHCLEQEKGGIDLHVNADKSEYMSFNRKED